MNNDVWNNALGASNKSITFYLDQDPLFFDASAEQCSLRLGSPCLDSDSAAYASSTSYNGLSRPQGAGVDIGAYEMFPPVHLPIVLRGFH
ncbi:MAG: hypothetical protein J7L73_00890 [Anaerolineales bacterium]|nr:hypothetical protein [Anaerolineales bacterium]